MVIQHVIQHWYIAKIYKRFQYLIYWSPLRKTGGSAEKLTSYLIDKKMPDDFL